MAGVLQGVCSFHFAVFRSDVSFPLSRCSVWALWGVERSADPTHCRGQWRRFSWM